MSEADSIWTWHPIVFGAAVSLAAWSAATAFSRAAARPGPAVLRHLRPLLAALAPLFARLVPRPLCQRMERRLQHADLDGTLSAAEWWVLLALCGVASALIGGMVTGSAAATAGASFAGAAAPELWLADRVKRLTRALERDLPHLLGLLCLAVEGGCALGAALRLACDSARGSPVALAFERALREIRAGQPRAAALAQVGARHPSAGLAALTSALIQADIHGVPIGELLRAQAAQRTEERFARAERLAMQSPVKMLAPLIVCIFPCAFLVLGFPIAVRLMQWA